MALSSNSEATQAPENLKMAPPTQQSPSKREDFTNLPPVYDEELLLPSELFHPGHWCQYTVTRILGLSLIGGCFFPQEFITTSHSKIFIISHSFYNTQTTRRNNLSKMTPPQRPLPVRSSSSTKPSPNDEESQPFDSLYDRESQLIYAFFYPQGWYQCTIVYLLSLLFIAFCLCIIASELLGLSYLAKLNVYIFRKTWLEGE
ncbi:hypothetical protein VF21_05949 [Pseudogymnoascus sp. 05NY08]|nr:hypothetical protein VF21_05949 [Pseudogymnoascus sp. 05NY08]